jgi:hypothetical protein
LNSRSVLIRMRCPAAKALGSYGFVRSGVWPVGVKVQVLIVSSSVVFFDGVYSQCLLELHFVDSCRVVVVDWCVTLVVALINSHCAVVKHTPG